MDDQGGERYRMRQMSEVLNLSRSSLIYYESIGLVRPEHREGGGYREYGDQEVFDLFSYGALRNIGFSGKEVADLACRHADLFDDEVLGTCLDRIDERFAFLEGLRDSVARIRRIAMRRGEGQGRVESIEPWLFYEDGAEAGYRRYAGNEQLDLLVACVPISGFGVLYAQGDAGAQQAKWGRTIPARWARLAGVDPALGRAVGGCRCYTKVLGVPSVREDSVVQRLGEVEAELHEQGLAPCGTPFIPYAFPPASKDVWVRLCVPVED